MQLSKDVHNYMDTLVGQVLAQERYITRYTNDQLADLACLALNQIRPLYIRFDIDFLSSLAEERLMVLKQQATAAVEAAELMIIDDRRINRDNVTEVVHSQRMFDEDVELEWYEEPILSYHSLNKV